MQSYWCPVPGVQYIKSTPWTVTMQNMASKPRAMISNRSKSGSAYVNSATLLRKKGSNRSAKFGKKFHSRNRKSTNHQANSAENKLESYLPLNLTLITWHHMWTRDFYVPSWQTHLNLSDQHHTCCIFLRIQANLHSISYKKHIRLVIGTLNYPWHISIVQGL